MFARGGVVLMVAAHLFAGARAAECDTLVTQTTCEANAAPECAWYKTTGPCVQKAFGTCPSMDVVFVVDSTAAMSGAAFGTVTDGYASLLDTIQTWSGKLPLAADAVRIGWVLLNDTTPITSKPITNVKTELDAAVTALKALPASGGGDIATSDVITATEAVYTAAASTTQRRIVVFFTASAFMARGDLPTFLADPDVTSFVVSINDNAAGIAGNLTSLATLPAADHMNDVKFADVATLLDEFCTADKFFGKQVTTPPSPPPATCDPLLTETECKAKLECAWPAAGGPCREKKYENCPVIDLAVHLYSHDAWLAPFGTAPAAVAPVGLAGFVEVLRQWIDGLPLATMDTATPAKVASGVRLALAQGFSEAGVTGVVGTQFHSDRKKLYSELQQQDLLSRATTELGFGTSLKHIKDAFATAQTTANAQAKKVVVIFSVTGVPYQGVPEAEFLSSEDVTVFSIGLNDSLPGDEEYTTLPYSTLPHDEHATTELLANLNEMLEGLCNEVKFIGKAVVAPGPIGDACSAFADQATCAAPACVWYDGTGPCAPKAQEGCPSMDIVVAFPRQPNFSEMYPAGMLGYAGLLEVLRAWIDQLPLATSATTGGAITGKGIRVGLVQFSTPGTYDSAVTNGRSTLYMNLQRQELEYMQAASTNLNVGLQSLENMFTAAATTGVDQMRVVLLFTTETVVAEQMPETATALSGSRTFSIVINDRYPAPVKNQAFASLPKAGHYTSVPLSGVAGLLNGLCDQTAFMGKQLAASPVPNDCKLPTLTAAACAAVTTTTCGWYSTTGPCAADAYQTCPEMDIVIMFDATPEFQKEFGTAYPSGFAAFIDMLGDFVGDIPLAPWSTTENKFTQAGFRVGLVQYAGTEFISHELSGDGVTLYDNLHNQQLRYLGTAAAGGPNPAAAMEKAKDLLTTAPGAGATRKKVILTFQVAKPATTDAARIKAVAADTDITAFAFVVDDNVADPAGAAYTQFAKLPAADNFRALRLGNVPFLLQNLCAEAVKPSLPDAFPVPATPSPSVPTPGVTSSPDTKSPTSGAGGVDDDDDDNEELLIVIIVLLSVGLVGAFIAIAVVLQRKKAAPSFSRGHSEDLHAQFGLEPQSGFPADGGSGSKFAAL
ncbi:hypothetical protein DIPPA_12261 [Diplonema papillatum]|nr:hypothetical protein DIPPA_12261 [Diplonema papillatum]